MRFRKYMNFEQLEGRYLLNADWQNPLDARDTNTDGFISPIDVLLIINDLNRDGARQLQGLPDAVAPYVDVSGDGFVSALDALLVINYLNSEGAGPVFGVMLESESTVHAESLMPIEPGPVSGTRQLFVDLEELLASPTPGLATQDVLSVYVVDINDPSMTWIDRGSNGSAVFSLSGVNAEFVPGISSWDGQTLRIDVTSLADRTDAALKFQLLNGDGSVRSMLRVNSLRYEIDSDGIGSEVFVSSPVVALPGPSVNADQFTPRTDVHLTVRNVQYDTISGLYQATLSLDNQGASIGRNAVVAFDGLPPTASLFNVSGVTGAGLPYLNFAPAIVGAGLGQLSQSLGLQVQISNPDNLPMVLASTVLVGAPNAAPTLPPIPQINVVVGDRVEIELNGSDADGDPLTYTLARNQNDGSPLLPSIMLEDGKLVVAPAPDQVGMYAFDLFASDGMLFDSQTVHINIQSDSLQTTRISGRVLDVDGEPLVGVRVEIGANQVLTQTDGSFLIDVGVGALPTDTIKIRGELLAGEATYPFIAEKLPLLLHRDVYRGVNNVIARPIYLPKIDVANGKTIDPTQTTIVTTAAIPQASVNVAAGTLMNQQGTPFTGQLSITEVPLERTPAVLPEGLQPDLVVTIQPGEMVFAAPAPLTLPNRSGLAPGIKLDLWSINPVSGEFEVVGVGQVSTNGQSIQTISGGIRNSSWHFFAPEAGGFEFDEHNYEHICQCPTSPTEAQSGPQTEPVTSDVVLHTGHLLETHQLVSYRSLGVQRAVQLVYSTERLANDRSFFIRYPDLGSTGQNLVTGGGEVETRLEMSVRVHGDGGNLPPKAYSEVIDSAVQGGFNSAIVPGRGRPFGRRITADTSRLPTGFYTAEISSGIFTYVDGVRLAGSSRTQSMNFLHVNTRTSPIGAGWSVSGLSELIFISDGSIMLVDGSGGQSHFQPMSGGGYSSPASDFSVFARQADGSFTRTLPDQSVHRYNAKGLLVSLADRLGNTTAYSYDSRDRLIRITDPVGLETNFAFSMNGKLTTITDPMERVTEFEHDGRGNLAWITDPDGTSRQFGYDSAQRMVREINKRGFLEETRYSANGRVYESVRADKTLLHVTPAQSLADTSGLPTSVFVDANGNPTRYVLNRYGQVVSMSDAVGPGVSYVRNDNSQITKSIDERGFLTRFGYDSSGNVAEVEDTNSTGAFQGEMFFISELLSAAKVADINGDEISDIVGAEVNNDRVIIRAGNGLGGLVSPTYITVGDSPTWLETGDFNSDGALDIVVGSNPSYVLLSDGLGGFTRNQLPVVLAKRFAVGDINLDGHLDIVRPGVDFVLHGDGTGRFHQQTAPAIGGIATDTVVLVDLNNDARVDIVIQSGTQWRVLYANAEGSFNSSVAVPTREANTIVLADINNDGLTDIINGGVASFSGGGLQYPGIQVQIADGNGGFVSTTHAAGHVADSILVQDLNADGELDIVAGPTSSPSSSWYVVLRGTGAGGFQLESSLTLPAGMSLGYGHFDGNREPDLAVIGRSRASIALADGQGGFLTPRRHLAFDSGAGGVTSLAIGDVTNDQRIDMVAGLGLRGVTLLSSNTAGGFDPVPLTTFLWRVEHVAVGDLNSDGWLDIVIAGADFDATFRNGSVATMLSDGAGGFHREAVVTTGLRPNSLGLADVNNDGHLDLMVTTINSDIISVRLGSGDGRFGDPALLNGGDRPGSLVVADVDGDGTRDILVANGNSDRVSLLLNSGNGSFSPPRHWTVGDEPLWVTTGDVNGDGLLDIISSNNDSWDLSVLLGAGAGTFLPQIRVPLKNTGGSGALSISAGDLDRDGLDDLVVATNASGVQLVYGARNANFQVAGEYWAGQIEQSAFSGTLTVVDLNQDAVLDIVAASGGNYVAPLLGSPTALRGTSLRQMEYDPHFSQLTRYIDELGRQTLLDVDPANGNIRSITQVIGLVDTASGEADDLSTQFTFTSHGLVDTITDPLGRITDIDYDTLGRVIQVVGALGTADEARRLYEYDPAGNVTATVDPNGSRTEIEYDAMNRVTRIIEADPDGAGPLTSPITTLTYDQHGNVVRMDDPKQQSTEIEYDRRDRVVRVIDEQLHVTQFIYDNEGNLVESIDPLGQVVKREYDARDRVVRTIDPDGGVTKLGYDFGDNLIRLTDPVGNVSRFAYDFRGRMIEELDPLSQSIRYQYDAANNLIRKTDRNGRVTEFAYDDVDRRTIETWVNANSTTANTIEYAYDMASNLTSITDAVSSLAFTYDALDRVRSVDNAGTPGAPQVVLDYTYDAIGNVLSVVDSINGTPGAATNYLYDALHRTQRITQTTAAGGSSVQEKRVDFTYNPLGQYEQIARFADLNATQPVVETNFSYDILNRLTDLRHTTAGGDVAFYTYTYDADSRITSIADVDALTTYTYDDRDQLTGAKHTPSVPGIPTNRPDESYSYDANGNRRSSHLHGSSYVTGLGNRLLSDGTYNYTYDDEGNMLRRTEIATGAYREFTWDHRNRLIAVVDMTSADVKVQRIEFSYDAINRRIAKEVITAVDHVLTHFVYDGEDVLLDFVDPDGEGPAPADLDQRYFHGPGIDQVLAQEDATENTRWHLTDHLGTVRDLVDNVGAVVNHIQYDSYGNVLSQSNLGEGSRYLYTGREYDPEFELYFYRARYYDAKSGSFIGEDSIGFSGKDQNLYRYVFNHPPAFSDPSGLEVGSPKAKYDIEFDGGSKKVSRKPKLQLVSITVEPLLERSRNFVSGENSAIGVKLKAVYAEAKVQCDGDGLYGKLDFGVTKAEAKGTYCFLFGCVTAGASFGAQAGVSGGFGRDGVSFKPTAVIGFEISFTNDPRLESFKDNVRRGGHELPQPNRHVDEGLERIGIPFNRI